MRAVLKGMKKKTEKNASGIAEDTRDSCEISVGKWKASDDGEERGDSMLVRSKIFLEEVIETATRYYNRLFSSTLMIASGTRVDENVRMRAKNFRFLPFMG